MIYLLLFLSEALWCCSLHSSSCFVKIIFFSLLVHLTRVLCHLFKFFHLIKFCLSFSNLSAVWNPSYPLCHSFNSSRGSVLLISSSITPSSQVHVQFLPFTAGVLPKLYHSYSFLSRFNQSGFNSFLFIVLVIHSFATSNVNMVFLVSLFYWTALNFVQLYCVILSSLQPLEVHWFHSFVEETT